MLDFALDLDQQKIVDLGEGFHRVYATAGAGKSTTLLARAVRLYQENKKIKCFCFGNEAAKSLRKRCGKQYPLVDTRIFSTLHAAGLKFANDYAKSFPFPLSDNPLADESTGVKAVFEATQNKISYKAFTSWVSLQKRKKIDYEQAIHNAERTGIKVDYALAYKKYQRKLQSLGVLDFDDLLFYMDSILTQRPDIRNMEYLDHVLVDEAQDLSEVDWDILKKIGKNITAVGDVSQSLYGFRGGIPEHFLNMDKYFQKVETHVMGRNYRSTPEIVELGKKANPFQEIAEKCYAVREQHGQEPSVSGFSTDFREAESVIQKIKNYPADDCAILARTNQALRVFEDYLIEENIKYYLLGDSGFWEAPEIQYVLYYVRCAYMLTDNAVLGALRGPFWPSRFIKKKTAAEQIKNLIETKNITAWRALDHVSGTVAFKDFLRDQAHLNHLPAGEAVASIIKNLRAVELYSDEEHISPDRNPIDNLKELCRAAGRRGNLQEFLEWIRKVQGYARNRKGVCLSTVHASKGREFERVFFVNCSEGVLPHVKSDNIEEEKCVFFVGVSRAKDSLDISYQGAPSPFLKGFLKLSDD